MKMDTTTAIAKIEAEIPSPVVPYVEEHPAVVLLNVNVRQRFLSEIEAEIAAFEEEGHDISAKKDRESIKSMAYKVAQTKAPIEKAAKDLCEDWKKKTAAVNADKKAVLEVLDALRDRVRAPVNAWEAKEAEREQAIKDDLDFLDGARTIGLDDTSATLKRRLAAVEAIDGDVDRVEAKVYAIKALTAGIARLEKEEADRAELEALRREKAQRESEEAARISAANKEREDAERRELEAMLAKERAEAAAERERDRQEAAKAKADADAARAEVARMEAEKKASEEAERTRIVAAEAEARAEAARKADAEHRSSVIAKAVAGVQKAGGLGAAKASNIVDAIVAGKIPGVRIEF
jgi:hypothetical protein